VAAESGFKRGGVELRGMGRRWGDILRHRVQNIFEDAGAVRKGRKESAHEGCVAQAPSPHRYRCGALPRKIIFTLAAKSGIGVQFLRF
jgi:hypothetical protein